MTPFLVTDYLPLRYAYRFLSNTFLWDVINHPVYNFNGGLTAVAPRALGSNFIPFLAWMLLSIQATELFSLS